MRPNFQYDNAKSFIMIINRDEYIVQLLSKRWNGKVKIVAESDEEKDKEAICIIALLARTVVK